MAPSVVRLLARKGHASSEDVAPGALRRESVECDVLRKCKLGWWAITWFIRSLRGTNHWCISDIPA
jgi:hypothetical protein